MKAMLMARMTEGRRAILTVLAESGPLTRVMVAAELNTDHLLLADRWRPMLDLGWISVVFERQETKHGPTSQFLEITEAGKDALEASETKPIRIDLDVQNQTAQQVLVEGSNALGYSPEQLLNLRRNQLAEMQARNILLRFGYENGVTLNVLAAVFGFGSYQTVTRAIEKTERLLDVNDSEVTDLWAKVMTIDIAD